MDLNGVGSIDPYSEISETGYNRSVQGDTMPPPFKGNGEKMDISGSGRIMNAISQMSETEKSEIKTFHDELMEAVKNGTFDASEMAANAPESLVELSEETGIDLEQMVEGMANGPQDKRGSPPPLPQMIYGADGKGISFNDDNEGELLTGLLLSDDTDTVEQS